MNASSWTFSTFPSPNTGIFHIFDEGTHFSTDIRLIFMKTMTVWNTIINCRTSIYTVLHNRIIIDQASNFGDANGSLGGIKFERTGTEAHNGLWISERNHSSIRTKVRKIVLEHPKTYFDFFWLRPSSFWMTPAGHDSLVPSVLVLEEHPRLGLPQDFGPWPTTEDRSELSTLARHERDQQLDKFHIDLARGQNFPSEIDW